VNVIRSFDKHHTLTPKRGRPVVSRDPTLAIWEASHNPFLAIRNRTDQCKGSRVDDFAMRHNAGIHFYHTTLPSALTDGHIAFRHEFHIELAFDVRPETTISTDESLFEVDLGPRGIWRLRGEHPEDSFFRSDLHPVRMDGAIWFHDRRV
jgi:hypothetical protein